MKKKTLYWIIGLFLLVIIALIALKKSGKLGTEDGLKVAIEQASLQNIIESVNASGKIYATEEVKVSPDVSGEIQELYVEEGDHVQKGQLIAKIDASLYNSTVSRANAQVNQSKSTVENAKAQLQNINSQLQQAKNNFERNLQLYHQKVISAAEFEQIQSTYKGLQANYQAAIENINGSNYGIETAKANLTEANQNIHRTNIFSPITGVVTKLNVKKGERVVGTAQMAGTEIMRISNLNMMKVDVDISENDIQKINLNDSTIITVDAYSKRKFKGQVNKIAQSVTSSLTSTTTDQISNYTVSILIDKETYADLLLQSDKFPFRPGMSASVEIQTKHHNQVLSVPINAVTTRDADTTGNSNNNTALKEYVFVVNAQNKAILSEVKTDIQDNTYIEILSGISKGSKVIVAPYSAIANLLKDKMAVQVVDKKKLLGLPLIFP